MEPKIIQREIFERLEKEIEIFFNYLVQKKQFALTPHSRVENGVIIEGYKNGAEFAKVFTRHLEMRIPIADKIDELLKKNKDIQRYE